MTDTRQQIFQRIRWANERKPQSGDTSSVQQRLRQHSRGPQPRWPDELMPRFLQKVEKSAATYEHVRTSDEIEGAVVAYLATHSLVDNLVVAGTSLLKGLHWPETLMVETRTATVNDKVVLVEAFAGIAETGSVVMCSSKESPVSLNFLPDHFICVVNNSSIVNTIEDVWDRVRQSKDRLPRAINIITGPSRTADVEQIIQMGAHGPRRVHLLLLD